MSVLIEIMKNHGGNIDPESNRCLDFSDVKKESDGTLNRVYDFTHHSHLELTGEDRTKFLNNFCSAKIVDLSPGQGTEAFALDIKGHILQHIFAFITEKSIQIESGANAEEFLFNHFDHYLITEDVEINRHTEEWASLFLTGNEIVSFLDSEGLSKQEWPMNSHGEFELNKFSCKIRRVDILEQPGFILCCSKNEVASLWEYLVNAGVVPAGEDSWQAVRIESGFPIYGVDITDANLAQEASRSDKTISFTKGCYLGQETVARIDSVGHVNKQLCRMEVQGNQESFPESGTVIQDLDGNNVGETTSSAWSPGRNSFVALGCLKKGFTSPGMKLTLSTGLSCEIF